MSPTAEKKDPLVDRLTAEQGADRTYYALGTMLGAEDFQDEQLYHRGRLARALAYLFGAGTVAGLRVRFRGEETPPGGEPVTLPAEQHEIIVEAGLALDPFGRLIEVPRRVCLRLARWFDAQDAGLVTSAIPAGSDRAAAWLFVRFRPCERGRTPVIAEGPFDATNATAPSRIRDAYEVRLFLDGDPDEPKLARAGTTGAEHLTPALRPPLPGAPGSAARLTALRDALLDGWGRPNDMREDAGWVLLGRVDIATVLDGGVRRYDATTPALVDNHLRPFAYGGWALALNEALPLPARTAVVPGEL